MKLKSMVLLVVFWASLLPLAWADDMPLFSLVSDDPVIVHSEDTQAWDGRYTDPGAVLYYDGMFHMFRNGFRSWPGEVQIAYHTSPDGITWTQVGDAPVLTSEEVPFAGLAALASSVLVEEDGTWVLYFYTWESYASTAPGQIGRATATVPTGPWTVDPQPLLSPGTEDEWDALRVIAPRVVKTEDGYMMYYGGAGAARGEAGIGLATSLDGITWTKQPAPLLKSEVENVFIHQPNVVQTADGWLMIYRSNEIGRSAMWLGYALSQDGINWTIPDNNVVWVRDSIARSDGFWWTALTAKDDTYYLYVEGGRSGKTDIYVGTYQGSFE